MPKRELANLVADLPDDVVEQIVVIARAVAMGLFRPDGKIALITFSTSDLRDAFIRAYDAPTTVGITLGMPRGGAQPVKTVEVVARVREEDFGPGRRR